MGFTLGVAHRFEFLLHAQPFRFLLGATFAGRRFPCLSLVLTGKPRGQLLVKQTALEVRDGEFSWNFELPKGLVGEYSHSPIDFHDPSQAAGAPFFDEDRFIIKFNNFWTIEAPPGYSLLFTHPINRSDLPFTTLTGLVDCDTFHRSPVHFPARWHDAGFNGVLPKGTPVAQCLPVKRETWSATFEELSSEGVMRMIETQDATDSESGVYRRQFRAPKR